MTSVYRNKIHTFDRALALSDACACAALHACAFTNSWNSRTLRGTVADPRALSTGLFDYKNEKLLGFIISRFVAPDADLLTIVIDQNLHAKGLGGRLLKKHISHLQDRGIKQVFLEVAETNKAALRLYEKCHAERIGIRKNYYLDEDKGPVNALAMKIDIPVSHCNLEQENPYHAKNRDSYGT